MRRVILSVCAAAGLVLLGMPAAQASAGGVPFKVPGNNTHRPAFDVRNTGRTNAQGITIINNTGWSGYADYGTTFHYVGGSYSVPSVNCAKTPSTFSYHWVGIDGAGNNTVEQDGIGSFCNGSTPFYFGWAWMYGNEGEVASIPVNPGDDINSSVTFSSGTYHLNLTDVTTGQSFAVAEKCTTTACNDDTAEAITEGYPTTGENGTSDFAGEHYDSVLVTDSAGAKGGLQSSHWNTDEYVSLGASGSVDTQPGPLATNTSSDVSAFRVTWLNEN